VTLYQQFLHGVIQNCTTERCVRGQWFATFSYLAGVDSSDNVPGVPPTDSVNVWPAIVAGGPSQHAISPPRSDVHAAEGVLVELRWKLSVVAPAGGHPSPWSGPLFPKVPAEQAPHDNCTEATPCLWDLHADER
jgi:hypothetical protein